MRCENRKNPASNWYSCMRNKPVPKKAGKMEFTHKGRNPPTVQQLTAWLKQAIGKSKNTVNYLRDGAEELKQKGSEQWRRKWTWRTRFVRGQGYWSIRIIIGSW